MFLGSLSAHHQELLSHTAALVQFMQLGDRVLPGSGAAVHPLVFIHKESVTTHGHTICHDARSHNLSRRTVTQSVRTHGHTICHDARSHNLSRRTVTQSVMTHGHTILKNNRLFLDMSAAAVFVWVSAATAHATNPFQFPGQCMYTLCLTVHDCKVTASFLDD